MEINKMEKLIKNKEEIKKVMEYLKDLLDAPEDILEVEDSYKEELVIFNLLDRYSKKYKLSKEWEIN